MSRQVRCNKCGYTADESEFKHNRDFFQNRFVSGCPKCDNLQSPGNASMRMFGGERPFVFIEKLVPPDTALNETLKRAGEAS